MIKEMIELENNFICLPTKFHFLGFKFKTQKGSVDRVIFLIDPIRVFHDMLVMDDNPSNFHIEIVNWNKIRQGEYKYDVLRVLNKKNKNRNNQNFIDALTHQYGRK